MIAKRRNLLVKIAVAAAVLAGLGWLFVRSARTARSAPYTLLRPQLRDWSLALESASSPTAPLLVLRPPPELAPDLFHQIFARAMETLSAPEVAGMPLLLQNEFDAAFAGRVTPAALLAAARTTGLESTVLEPRCLALRRVSEPGDHAPTVFRAVRSPGIRTLSQPARRDGWRRRGGPLRSGCPVLDRDDRRIGSVVQPLAPAARGSESRLCGGD